MLKIKRISILFICIFVVKTGNSQLPALYQNEEIIWMGESNLEYIFEDPHEESLILDYQTNFIDSIETKSSSSLIKIDLIDDEIPSTSLIFENWISSLIRDETIIVKDLTNSKNLSTEERANLLFYPGRLNDDGSLDMSTCLEFHFNSYFIRQIWYYNKNEKKLVLIPIEIIPVYKINGEKIELFKIELPNISYQIKSPDLHRKDFKWVKRNIDKISFTSSIKQKKGNLKDFFESYLMESKYYCQEFHYYSNFRCNHIKDDDKNPNSLNKELFLKEKKLAETKISYEKIKGIELQQTWYLNDFENSLGSRLDNISPLILKEFGSREKIKMYKPIFSIKN